MSTNTIKALLIINAKKGWSDAARKKAALALKAKSKVKALRKQMSEGDRKVHQISEQGLKRIASGKPSRSKSTVESYKKEMSRLEAKVKRKIRGKSGETAPKKKKVTVSAHGNKLSNAAWKYEDKAGNSGSHADYQRAAKAHAVAAKHFNKAGDKKKTAYHKRKFKKYNNNGMKYRGTSDGMGGTY